jgi:hypothetical protein
MLKKALALSLLLILFNVVRAETICGEILIDDFEDGNISDWRMMYDDPDANKNITLSTFAHDGTRADWLRS